ncbi:alpha/beta fold hydrolase [Nocardia sp. NPDC050710]|uniref:alpha/beta hydrolase n=1 Tax=Nocardia sp. NPDC050710 TaxID=3157220 RepID=UPI0033E4CAD8
MGAPGPVHVVFVHGLFSSPDAWNHFGSLIEADPDLRDTVTVHRFKYASPRVQLRLARGIPHFDTIADALGTFLASVLPGAHSVVIVTHSQGGLVLQRFLARTIERGRASELARIKQIVMYSCPNNGSEFMLSIREHLYFWRQPQERELRPLNEAVVRAQQTVLAKVVFAHGSSESECRIPIAAYGGMTDKVVPPNSATWVFPMTGIVEGDHSSVIRPPDAEAMSYRVLKMALTAAAGTGAERTAAEPTERHPFATIDPPLTPLPPKLRGRYQLVAAVIAQQHAGVDILADIGGSGKSRIALEIARRLGEQGWRVWWISVPRISSSMRELANRLGAHPEQVEKAWRDGTARDLVWRLLNAASKPWILVFDNADDPQTLGPDNGAVSEGTGWLRIPATSLGRVLVTSRHSNRNTWGTWAVIHRVPQLDDISGAEILLDRVGPGGGTVEQARQLSHALGGLPLALVAAGRYLKSATGDKIWRGEHNITDFASYRAALERRFDAPPASEVGEPFGLGIVRGVFDLSLDLLTGRGVVAAAPLLRLFSCLNVAPIPYHLLLRTGLLAESPLFAGLDPQRALAALTELADIGLIDPDKRAGIGDPHLRHVLLLHPVVHGLFREHEHVRRNRADYYGLNIRMILAATEGFEPDHPENWPRWDSLIAHAVEIARVSLLGDPIDDLGVTIAALELARLTLRYLIITGLLDPAHELATSIVNDCAKLGFGGDEREILGLRHEIARIALERGELAVAEKQLITVIEKRSELLGADHADTLASRHKLARAIMEQGRWAEAEPVLRSIVLAEYSVRGPEHSDTMVVRHSLARSVLAQGRAEEAEAMVRDILEVHDRHWAPNWPETVFVRHTLVRCLLDLNKVDEAMREIHDALAIATAPSHLRLAMSFRKSLATALLFQGRVNAARKLLEELLKQAEETLGTKDPKTVRIRNLLTQVQQISPDSTDPGIPPIS